MSSLEKWRELAADWSRPDGEIRNALEQACDLLDRPLPTGLRVEWLEGPWGPATADNFAELPPGGLPCDDYPSWTHHTGEVVGHMKGAIVVVEDRTRIVRIFGDAMCRAVRGET